MPTKRLSDQQVAILKGMANGAKLRRSTITKRATLNDMTVNGAAVNGLVEREYVKPLPEKYGSFAVYFKLTDAGRSAVPYASPAPADEPEEDEEPEAVSAVEMRLMKLVSGEARRST